MKAIFPRHYRYRRNRPVAGHPRRHRRHRLGHYECAADVASTRLVPWVFGDNDSETVRTGRGSRPPRMSAIYPRSRSKVRCRVKVCFRARHFGGVDRLRKLASGLVRSALGRCRVRIHVSLVPLLNIAVYLGDQILPRCAHIAGPVIPNCISQRVCENFKNEMKVSLSMFASWRTPSLAIQKM